MCTQFRQNENENTLRASETYEMSLWILLNVHHWLLDCALRIFCLLFTPLGLFCKTLVTALGRLQNKTDELPHIVWKILCRNQYLVFLNSKCPFKPSYLRKKCLSKFWETLNHSASIQMTLNVLEFWIVKFLKWVSTSITIQ